jgi:uncharacterized RDD family membrane protein YckC
MAYTQGPQPGPGYGAPPNPTDITGKRVVAFLIDCIIFGAGIGVLFVLAVILTAVADLFAFMFFFVWLIAVVGFFAFMMFFEMKDGRTIGKRTQKIKVIRLDGQPMDTRTAFIRNISRYVDGIIWLGYINALTDSTRHQRLGDMWAKTLVVDENYQGTGAELAPGSGFLAGLAGGGAAPAGSPPGGVPYAQPHQSPAQQAYRPQTQPPTQQPPAYQPPPQPHNAPPVPPQQAPPPATPTPPH